MIDASHPACSVRWFNKAKNYMPGGVNSPVRSFSAVGGIPRFIRQAQGAYVIDEDGQRYIDYVGSWGPMILGHAHPTVLNAVHAAVERGLSFGAPCVGEVALAEKIVSLMPSLEKIRLVNSGTEAAMSAIRLARAYTKRKKIIKFIGCYHGHTDSLLIQAGSGALTFGVPSSPGVTEGSAQDTLLASFNDIDSVIPLFEQQGSDIAAVIVEPIAANMNVILPVSGFLSGLRELCNHYQSLLIFDEIITGFRVALGGAQSLYAIRPDLTLLGKIIGGGMPVGAFGGRRDIMDHLAPTGAVYQAGTLSGNPVAMAAGLATLIELKKTPSWYTHLHETTQQLVEGIRERARAAHIPFTAHAAAGLFGLFFSEEEHITRYEQVMACDRHRFTRFFHTLLHQGIYLAPSPFEAGFVSTAHGQQEIAQTLEAVEVVFSHLAAYPLVNIVPVPRAETII